jgi:hypothetical protein
MDDIYLFTTDLKASNEWVVTQFAWRWSIEGVCPVNRVIDEHGEMSSERRAYPCPKANRAIRGKSSSGAAGYASGKAVV